MSVARKWFAQRKEPYSRIDPRCAHFGACGGCSLQDLSYTDQLDIKARWVADRLKASGDGQGIPVQAMRDPWRYRNKAEFTFAKSGEELVLGYHAAGSFMRVVPIGDCLLQAGSVSALCGDILKRCRETGLSAYHPRRHEGFFRHLLIRSVRRGEALIACLITTRGDAASDRLVRGIAESLKAGHPELRGFFWGVNDKWADTAIPESCSQLWGDPELEERIGPFKIAVGPFTFLQASVEQADGLYRVVSDAVSGFIADRGLAPRDLVAWDLYCGLGLVGFYLSPLVRKIYGIESEPALLDSAREHARLNGVENIEFHAGKAEDLLADRRFWLQEARPDVVVADPPRAGLHPSVIATLLGARPGLIVYVACNAEALARDLDVLSRCFPSYRVNRLHAFDLFAQTHHVETVAVLVRE